MRLERVVEDGAMADRELEAACGRKLTGEPVFEWEQQRLDLSSLVQLLFVGLDRGVLERHRRSILRHGRQIDELGAGGCARRTRRRVFHHVCHDTAVTAPLAEPLCNPKTQC